jgi:hypothetical protein
MRPANLSFVLGMGETEDGSFMGGTRAIGLQIATVEKTPVVLEVNHTLS